MDLGLFLEFPRRDELTEQEAMQESFAIVDEAEALGVDSVWLAEYHFNPGRILSAPITIAGAIAARTRRLRVGTAVQVLPLGNPVRIAEEVATLDHISQGRLEFGIGRGTFPNVHEGYNVPFAESRGRFEESLEIILKAWTTDSFSFEGEHYQCKNVTVVPKPFQKPHPPIRVGITSAETFPIIGRMGLPILINPSRVFALAELGPHIQQYRRSWQDAGHVGEPQVGLRVPVYVAETEEQAYSDPKDSAMFSVRRLGERVGSYADYTGTTGNWAQESRRILGMEYDDWLRDKVAFGTPQSVADKLAQLHKDLSLTQLIYEINFGNLLTYQQQVSSLRLFNQEVAPQLK